LALQAAAYWRSRPVAYSPRQTNNEFMFDRSSQRARQVIAISRWFAEKRGGSYIEPEDLLRTLIREDRGASPSLLTEMFTDLPVPSKQPTIGHRPFFDDNVPTDLLRELQDDAPV